MHVTYLITLLIQLVGGALSLNGIKILALHASPFFALFVRHSLSCLIMVHTCNRLKIKIAPLMREIPRHLFTGAFTRTFFPSLLANWVLRSVPVAKFSFFYGLSPFISAIFCRFMINERLNAWHISGILVGCSSVIPIVAVKSTQEASFGSLLFSLSVPEFLSILIIISMCYGWVEFKKLTLKHPTVSELGIQVYDFGLGVIGAGIGALIFENTWLTSETSYTTFVGLSLGVAFLSSFINGGLYAWHVKRLNPTLLSLCALTKPFFAGSVSWLIWGESFGIEALAASGLALIGTLLFIVGKNKKTKTL